MRFLTVFAIAASVAAFAWPSLRGMIRSLPALPANNVVIAVGLLVVAGLLLFFTARGEQ